MVNRPDAIILDETCCYHQQLEMSEPKTKCSKCGASILPSTATQNNGRCKPCASGPKLDDVVKRIVLYLVAFGIVIYLLSMLPPVVVDNSCFIVVRNGEDSITREHIFYSLDAEGIEILVLGSHNDDVLFFKIPKYQFDDAIDIVESAAKNSNTIKIIGFDERGDLWVDRGLGEEFSTAPGQEIDPATDIPEKFRDLIVAINDEFPDSRLTNDDSAITRFAVSKRRYLSSSGEYKSGFDVTFNVLQSDQTTVSMTYQITNTLTDVRIISTENIK